MDHHLHLLHLDQGVELQVDPQAEILRKNHLMVEVPLVGLLRPTVVDLLPLQLFLPLGPPHQV